MRTHSFSRLGVAAVAATVLAACSSSSASGTDWSAKASANDGGGLQAMISAAKAEGQLNLIAIPRNWAGYGNIIDGFQAKYGIHINSASPGSDSKDEIAVVKKGKSSQAPDVLDLNMDAALANTDLFTRYQVSEWADIPLLQKDSHGLWYQDYGGFMSIGYDSGKLPAISSIDDLATAPFHGKIALYGDPTVSNEALYGVMMVALAEGGTPDNIGPGVDFFHKLKLAGNFTPIQPTTTSIKTGQTQLAIDWDYLTQPNLQNVATWQVFIPPTATLGSYFAQAINKNAPHPAAARLWEEYLYSDAGQNALLRGGVRPVRMAAMQGAGVIDRQAAAALPPITGSPLFMTPGQITSAQAYVTANWRQAVG